MNSQSKQCPKCQGMRWVAPEYKPLEDFLCCECKGTGEVSSSYPTTAGSEPPAGPSRRRSLPALEGVLTYLDIRMDEERLRAEDYKKKGDLGGFRMHEYASAVLGAVRHSLAATFR